MNLREREAELFEVPRSPMQQNHSNAYAYKHARLLPWASETEQGILRTERDRLNQYHDAGVPINASTGADLLNENQVAAAIERNKHFGAHLWTGLRTPICIYYLRYYRDMPDDSMFAQAVARWQYAVGGLKVNGQLDATTWHMMRRRGEAHHYTTPEGLQRPGNFREVVATFGNPQEDRATWERQNITRINAPSGYSFHLLSGRNSPTIHGHRLLKTHFERLFETIVAAGLWDAIQPVSGPFAFRNVRDGTQLSMHAFGIAIDINPKEYARNQKKHFPSPDIVHIFQDYGFHWGMFWTHPDPMHFQFATGA